MEDSTTSSVNKITGRMPLGMSSFGPKEREHFGRNIRLAMACIEGAVEPADTRALPSDSATIRQRLKALSQDMTSYHADLLELLVRFDELEGYKSSGASHCAAWMNSEIGISVKTGWEYLRVGRKLRLLPTTIALFRAGKLSWSKVRVLVNVADPDNEKTLCHAALDASVTDVVRLCNEYRWREDGNDGSENDLALKQWESRSLTWDETSNGSILIKLALPPERARAFLNGVEHSLTQLDDSEDKFTQRRADAAVLMAEASLQAAGRDVSNADRYQVIVSVDAAEMSASDSDAVARKNSTPSKRATIKGVGPIARETARRIACDCSITTNTITNGEPTNIGRKSRLWPPAMARAIKNRDQHCQFYGCTQSHNLQIHHITHWADGGTTCVANGACLCQFHHTMVHEGGYSIQRVSGDEQRMDEQFAIQHYTGDTSQFNIEAALRNDRTSFNTVRRLSATRYRFRIVDADGFDIRCREVPKDGDVDYEYSMKPEDSPRGECAEPRPSVNGCGMSGFRRVGDSRYHIF